MTGLDLQWARLGTNVWLHNSNRNEVVRPNLPTKKDMSLQRSLWGVRVRDHLDSPYLLNTGRAAPAIRWELLVRDPRAKRKLCDKRDILAETAQDRHGPQQARHRSLPKTNFSIGWLSSLWRFSDLLDLLALKIRGTHQPPYIDVTTLQIQHNRSGRRHMWWGSFSEVISLRRVCDCVDPHSLRSTGDAS